MRHGGGSISARGLRGPIVFGSGDATVLAAYSRRGKPRQDRAHRGSISCESGGKPPHSIWTVADGVLERGFENSTFVGTRRERVRRFEW